MSEEIIKQEEAKQEDVKAEVGKDEYTNFPIFLYFAGSIWMIIIAIILMFAFGKILAPAVVFFWEHSNRCTLWCSYYWNR